MRSAHLTSLLQALSRPEVRVRQATDAVLLLDADLSRVMFANAAARRFFALAPRADTLAAASPAARQIRSTARLVAEKGEARVMLRAATGLAAQPLPASLTRLTGEPATVLLAIPGAPGAAEPEAADLFFAAGDDALLLGADGAALSPSPADAPALGEVVRAFLASGEATATVTVAGRSIDLARLSDSRVAALLGPEEPAAAEAEPPAAPAEPESPSPHALSIASIVRRWQTQREGDKAAAAEPPPPPAPVDEIPATPAPQPAAPLRSLWGPRVPEASNAGEREDWDAVPGDAAVEAVPETAQPADLPGAVTLPDVPSEDAPDLDVPLSVDEESPQEQTAEPAAPVAAPARFDAAPVRFVWQIDRDGRFRSISPEFAAAVGAGVAAVVGLRFADVAERLRLDGAEEVQRLLERRDTWSGRTVLWPVEGTGRRAPIDLAALPVYGRDRSFEGFRGFGIARLGDHVPDVTGHAPLDEPVSDEAAAPAPADTPETPDLPLHTIAGPEAPVFGRRAEPPQSDEADEAPKVIRLEERRRPRETLSQAEEAAFREIGAKLGNRTEAESPGALRFEAATVEDEEPTDDGEEFPASHETMTEEPPEALPAAAEDEPSEAEEPAAAALAVELEPLLAALPMPLLVRSDDRLVFANRALLDLAGHPDLAALDASGGLEALFDDEAPAPSVAGEMSVRRADGGPVPMRVHLQRIAFRGRSSLLMAFAPAEAGVAREAACDDLQHEVEELRAVLDTATDGILLLDPAGTVRAMNGSAHALFGAGPEEAKGRPLVSFFAHESQKTVLDYLETLKDTGLAGILNDGREVTGRVAQGGFIPLFITVGRLSVDRGWCVVIRDITHWKRIEEDLVNARRQAEAASLHKSRFLANISHELRTPLNAIIGFADVMATECFGPIGNERYIEYLGDIKRSGHHVLDLVNDLLDISKIEAGKLELTFEAVSLNEVLAEVVALMQPQANRERVIVRSNLPSTVPAVVADRRTIRQIALNLVSNAIRFTPAGGQIIASTTYTSEGTVLMRFRDSGIGMTEREIEIALTPFQQVQPAGTQERGAGTGLGLPLTKAMVEANRATFTIQSAPGEGTLVEIVFPGSRVLAD